MSGHRSYSQLTEWMKCGESYRLNRKVRIPERPSWWLPGGSAFHEATEAYDRGECETHEIGGVFLDQFGEHIDRQIENAPDQWKDTATWRAASKGREDQGWWIVNGVNMSIAYVKWRERNPNLVIAENGVETALMVELGGVMVKMYVDRIFADTNTGQFIVIDLKTGSSDQPSSLQLGTYKVGIEKLVGYPIDWGAFYNARKGELSPPVPLSHWNEQRIGQMFAQFDAQETAGQYLPNIGSHCKYMCSFREHCVYQGGTPHPDDEGV